jgi:hypothetical protein
VTIPSEVSRGVVARSVAALSKGSNRLLGYVENMSGYYCRDCDAIKPLFDSPGASGLPIPCLGTVPFDPELARHCDSGIPLADLPDTPLAARSTTWRSNCWTASTERHPPLTVQVSYGSARSLRDEVPLRPLRHPDEAPIRGAA